MKEKPDKHDKAKAKDKPNKRQGFNVALCGKSIAKICLSVGTMYAFYKVPGIVANKISYQKLIKKDFKSKSRSK